MNEPLFYNSFYYSKEMAKEIADYVFFKNKLMKFCYTVFAISIPLNIILSIVTGQIYFYQLGTYGLALIACAMFPFIYFSLIKANTPKYPDDELSTVIADENTIQGRWQNNEITCEIKKITLFFVTKNYIVVFTKLTGRTGMVLKKDSFSLGSSEDFIKLLKTKCRTKQF